MKTHDLKRAMIAAGVALGTFLVVAAAHADDAAAAAAAAAAAEATEAKSIYDSRCVTCHGAGGKGDGAAAAALNPPPRDLTLAEWQNSVDDAHIEKIITAGGPAVGKSPLMPPNPDLVAKPGVVKELRKIVRGFGGN